MLAGMKLENYKIGALIHEDVFGKVYTAEISGFSEPTHLQFLHAIYAQLPGLKEIFVQCAEKAGLIYTDGLTKILGCGSGDYGDFIVTQATELIPLEKALLIRGSISASEAVGFIQKLAVIVRGLHLEGQLHGCINPQNIYTNEQMGEIRLGGWGFEALIRSLLQNKNDAIRPILSYLSPEITSQGLQLQRQSDLYSLGALFYRLLVGKAPWEDQDQDLANLNGYRGPVIPPSLRRLDIPDILDDVVLRLLDPSIEKRYENISMFIKMLAQAQSDIHASYTPTSEFLFKPSYKSLDDDPFDLTEDVERIERPVDEQTADIEPPDEFNDSEQSHSNGKNDPENSEIAANGLSEEDFLANRKENFPLEGAPTRSRGADVEKNDAPTFTDENLGGTINEQVPGKIDYEVTLNILDDDFLFGFGEEDVNAIASEEESEHEVSEEVNGASGNESLTTDSLYGNQIEQDSDALLVNASETNTDEEIDERLLSDDSLSSNFDDDLDQIIGLHETPVFPDETSDMLSETVNVPNLQDGDDDEIHSAPPLSSPDIVGAPEEFERKGAFSDYLLSSVDIVTEDFVPSVGVDEPEPVEPLDESEDGILFPNIEASEFDDLLLPNWAKLEQRRRKNGVRNAASAPSPDKDVRTPRHSKTNLNKTPTQTTPLPKVAFFEVEEDAYELTDALTADFATTNTINLDFRPKRRRGMSFVKATLITIVPIAILYVVVAFLFGLNLDFRKNEIFHKLSLFITEPSQGSEVEARAPEKTLNNVVGNRQTRQQKQRPLKKVTQNKPKASPANPELVTNEKAAEFPSPERQLETNNNVNTQRPRPVNESRPQPIQRRPNPKPVIVEPNNLEFTVMANGQPVQALFFINGRLAGESSTLGGFSSPVLERDQSYLIRVQKAGFQMWAMEVTPTELRENNLQIDLLPERRAVARPNQEKVENTAEDLLGNGSFVRPLFEEEQGEIQRSQSPTASGAGMINILLSNNENISDAFIYVNGALWNGENYIAPTEIELPVGTYEIEVRRDGYFSAPSSRTVTILEGERQAVQFILMAINIQ